MTQMKVSYKIPHQIYIFTYSTIVHMIGEFSHFQYSNVVVCGSAYVKHLRRGLAFFYVFGYSSFKTKKVFNQLN